MHLLSSHLKETADIAAGYVTGQLFVEGGQVGVQRSNGEEVILDDSYLIEVRNGDVYERITVTEALTVKTVEEWPLYAGLYTREKKLKEGEWDGKRPRTVLTCIARDKQNESAKL